MTLLEKLRDHLVSTQEPDPIYKECYEALLSRDAEVAKWKDAYLKAVERIHMVGGYLDQSKERDKLRKQVTLLRDAKPITLASGVTLNTTKGYIYCGVGDSFYRAWEPKE